MCLSMNGRCSRPEVSRLALRVVGQSSGKEKRLSLSPLLHKLRNNTIHSQNRLDVPPTRWLQTRQKTSTSTATMALTPQLQTVKDNSRQLLNASLAKMSSRRKGLYRDHADSSKNQTPWSRPAKGNPATENLARGNPAKGSLAQDSRAQDK